MKIVNRSTFLSMPEGTLYSKYEPCVFEHLSIKGETLGNNEDFFYQQIVDSLDVNDSGELYDRLDNSQATGESIPMDFETQSRDGCYDEDQLFAVWSREDVQMLIDRLQRTVNTPLNRP